MGEFASKGVAGAGLGLGIAGTALGLLGDGVGKILTGSARTQPVQVVQPVSDSGAAMTAVMGTVIPAIINAGKHGCSEDHEVTRYEAEQAARIAQLETEVKLRDANTYTDQKILATYQYIDGELKEIRSTLCAQAVHNQRTEDSFVLARQDIAAVKAELTSAIAMEAERRCCADNAIVTYANGTFYPKMVADVEVGTETTAQSLYNPIPKCGCCCNG